MKTAIIYQGNLILGTRYIKEDTMQVESFTPFVDINKLFKPYHTADILFVDDDPIIRTLFKERMKKYKIKSDSEDLGRDIVIQTSKGSCDCLDKIIKYNNTFALVVIDENLGPNHYTGTQCIAKLREKGYKGAIISITGDSLSPQLVQKFKTSGANGCLIKNNQDFFSEIIKILNKLAMRHVKFKKFTISD